MKAFAVGIAAVALLVQQAKADPCTAAATLLNGMRYAEAQKAYADILKVDPSQTCARQGLEKIAQIRGGVAGHLALSSALTMANDKAVFSPWSSNHAKASESMTRASQAASAATPSRAAAFPARLASSRASVFVRPEARLT